MLLASQFIKSAQYVALHHCEHLSKITVTANRKTRRLLTYLMMRPMMIWLLCYFFHSDDTFCLLMLLFLLSHDSWSVHDGV